jgi:hypothetical protein
MHDILTRGALNHLKESKQGSIHSVTSVKIKCIYTKTVVCIHSVFTPGAFDQWEALEVILWPVLPIEGDWPAKKLSLEGTFFKNNFLNIFFLYEQKWLNIEKEKNQVFINDYILTIYTLTDVWPTFTNLAWKFRSMIVNHIEIESLSPKNIISPAP